MGLRMYQEIGLKPEAKEFLEKNVNQIVGRRDICPHCHKEIQVFMTKEIISEEAIDSFYGEGPILHKYRSRSGGVIKEILQAEPWSSGPCAFLCLEVDGRRMFEWTEEEMEEYL